MKRITPTRLLALGAAAVAIPAVAHAHAGSSLVFDCASGIAHPFHGWDHLAAMLAVGVWANQLGGRARWLLPAAFLSVMSAAAVLGAQGLVAPAIEAMLALSVLALGILIAASATMRLPASVTLVSAFAAFHGLAHGAEIPATVAPWSYGLGFVLASSALHVGGIALGRFTLGRSERLHRALGIVCAGTGAALLLA